MSRCPTCGARPGEPCYGPPTCVHSSTGWPGAQTAPTQPPPQRIGGLCSLGCGRTIDPTRDYRKVTGWERRRSEGGTNALAGREVSDEWACSECVNKIKRGLPVGQESML